MISWSKFNPACASVPCNIVMKGVIVLRFYMICDHIFHIRTPQDFYPSLVALRTSAHWERLEGKSSARWRSSSYNRDCIEGLISRLPGRNGTESRCADTETDLTFPELTNVMYISRYQSLIKQLDLVAALCYNIGLSTCFYFGSQLHQSSPTTDPSLPA